MGLPTSVLIIEWTITNVAGAIVAITARDPKRSTNAPKNGDMQAEIMYGMDITTAACATPSSYREQNSFVHPSLQTSSVQSTSSYVS